MQNRPGATQQYDHWQTLLREFLQNTSLDLRNKQLTQISWKLFHYKQITTLDLSDNQLTEVPMEIDELKNLKSLKLNSN
jgi:Leucine-rich repeat (LRR) protein